MRIVVLEHTGETFLNELKSQNVEYRAIIPNGPQASGKSYELLKERLSSGVLGTLALILYRWLRTRSSRRVQITFRDANQGISFVDIEGYPVDEVIVLLDKAQSITVIDTKPPDTLA